MERGRFGALHSVPVAVSQFQPTRSGPGPQYSAAGNMSGIPSGRFSDGAAAAMDSSVPDLDEKPIPFPELLKNHRHLAIAPSAMMTSMTSVCSLTPRSRRCFILWPSSAGRLMIIVAMSESLSELFWGVGLALVFGSVSGIRASLSGSMSRGFTCWPLLEQVGLKLALALCRPDPVQAALSGSATAR